MGNLSGPLATSPELRNMVRETMSARMTKLMNIKEKSKAGPRETSSRRTKYVFTQVAKGDDEEEKEEPAPHVKRLSS